MVLPWFLTLYGGVGAIALTVYLTLFLKDPDTPLTDATSWIVLLVATLLWPITLPISFKKELLPRWQVQRSPWLVEPATPEQTDPCHKS